MKDSLFRNLEYCAEGTPETGWFKWAKSRGNQISVGSWAGSINEEGYRVLWIDGKLWHEHRLVLWLFTGLWPKMVDHIDGDKLNNRPDNLRPADHRLNALNSKFRTSNKSGFRGVCFHKKSNKWRVQIRAVEKRITVECQDIFDAATVYNFLAARHYGDLAIFNEAQQPWLEDNK